MSGDGSLVYWSQETIHFSARHLNEDGIYDGEIIGVSAGDGRRGFRSQEIIQYFSHNRRFYISGDRSGDDGRDVYSSQDKPIFLSKSWINSSCLR